MPELAPMPRPMPIAHKSIRKRRRWPVTLWQVNMKGTEWKATKADVVDMIDSGIFPELERAFPELSKKHA